MPFSEKLKKLREENHYTQKYVAKHLNVARSTIAGYETKNRQPSHEKLTILAELFHVSVDYLLDDDCLLYTSHCDVRNLSYKTENKVKKGKNTENRTDRQRILSVSRD